MKIIFLDIDGVLNSEKSHKRRMKNERIPYSCKGLPSSENIVELNRITKATSAKLVISSSWRRRHSLYSLEMIFYLCGIDGEIIDEVSKTLPSAYTRGENILEWLKYNTHRDIKSFVIIDDSSDMGVLKETLIRTSFKTGLTEKEAKIAIEMLNVNRNLDDYIKDC